MRALIVFCSLGLLTFASCLTPTAGDFKGKNSPLSESELLVTWRVPVSPSVNEVLDTSTVFLTELESSMLPIREQLIPRIYDDLVQGNLTLYWVEGIENTKSGEPRQLSDVLSRIPDWTGDDISELSNVIHFSQRRSTTQKGMDATELGLSLIWRDADHSLPERPLGTVMFSDLDSLGYTLTVDGAESSIMEFLEVHQEFIYPIEFYTLEKQSWGLTTLEAAFGSREYVINGKWGDLNWLEHEPNLTEYSLQNRTKEELTALAGEYTFSPGQDDSFTTGDEPILVNVEPYNQSLWTSWSNKHQYYAYLVFPTEKNRFFSVTGDLITFEKTEGRGKRMIILTADGQTVIGEAK